MFSKLTIENFKGIAKAEFDFGKLAFLVGPNASGKTSVLEAMHLMSRLGTNTPSEVFADRYQCEAVIKKGSGYCLIELRFGGRNGEVTLRCVSPSVRLKEPATNEFESHWMWKNTRFEPRYRPSPRSIAIRSMLPSLTTSHEAMASICSCRLFSLDPSELGQPSYSDDQVPFVLPSGKGLASSIGHLALTEPDDFISLQSDLRTIVPSFRRLRVDRGKVQHTTLEPKDVNGERVVLHREVEVWGQVLELEYANGARVRADHASEGTLIALGILMAVYGPARPKVVLLDEIERALHPKALARLVGCLRKIVERHDVQIIATTHSPFIVGALHPDEVWLSNVSKEGEIGFTRLDRRPDYEKWKGVLNLGEYWLSVAEPDEASEPA